MPGVFGDEVLKGAGEVVGHGAGAVHEGTAENLAAVSRLIFDVKMLVMSLCLYGSCRAAAADVAFCEGDDGDTIRLNWLDMLCGLTQVKALRRPGSASVRGFGGRLFADRCWPG